MGQIRITPDQMRNRAREYDREAQNVDNVIHKMDSLLNQLESEWEGEAARAYSARFQELRPSFENARELITEIANALRQTATNLEDVDRQIASGFRG